ncbi:glycosyltransferase [Brevibacillus ruminantium]|uniref:Glycosyltransferase n=1 Tax=Brevibacillus ruminantium TaxID=2950604 RepID=A0ABY4WBP4_9BACL|nr:glycosyltransferase [Brevibacillus ruminantium]USG63347.1 glycosyltransferase [Brevibacillus ruminantium]
MAQANACQSNPRPDGMLVFICPARLVPYKGQRYLIEALSLLRQVRDDFICLFAGDGAQKSELETLAATLQVSHLVEFLLKEPWKCTTNPEKNINEVLILHLIVLFGTSLAISSLSSA